MQRKHEGFRFSVTMTAEAITKVFDVINTNPQKLDLDDYPDVLELKCSDPENLNMKVSDASGRQVSFGEMPGIAFNHPANITLSPEGIVCDIGLKDPIISSPGKPEEWTRWYTPEKTIHDLFGDFKQETSRQLFPQTTTLSSKLPQQTWEEMRVLGQSIADTSTLSYWSLAADSTSYLYRRPGDRHEIKFDPSTLPEIWSNKRPDTPDAMKCFLQDRGFNGWLTLQMAMNCAIVETDTPVAIDEFVRRLFDVRSTKDRNEKRIWVWETLCTIFNMRLYGVRAGTWKDPESKKVIDLTFRGEPLIAPSPGTRRFANGQGSLWPDDIPVTIGFTMGMWGKEAKKNPKTLQYFGNVQAILAIPGGKPSGAWARCILAALNQKWREKAKDVSITTHAHTDRNGTDHKIKAVHWPYAFTRRELLVNLFQPDERFSVMDILKSDRPRRAVTYWNDAIKILKCDKHVSCYRELEPLPNGIDGKPKRQGWQDDWLNQPLDIRPNEEGHEAAIEIKTSQKKAIATRKRKQK